MATEVVMPQLGESIHEGTVGKWLKQAGESVERFEPLVEIITDKVNSEIPSPVDGVLSEILIPEGETVEVGTVIARMETIAAEQNQATEHPPTRKETTLEQPSVVGQNGKGKIEYQPVVTAATRMEVEAGESSGVFPAGNSGGGWFLEDESEDWGEPSKPAGQTVGQPSVAERNPHRYTPVVRRMAEEYQLDLDKLNLSGSGLNGRVTRDDVIQYLETNRAAERPAINNPGSVEQPLVAGQAENVATTQTAQAFQPAPAPMPVKQSVMSGQNGNNQAAERPATTNVAGQIAGQDGPALTEEMFGEGSSDEFMALTPMRRAIAEHMTRSKQTTPHAWTIVEVDMTALVKQRSQLKEDFKRREGIDLTYLPFVIRAVIEGLKQFPHLNATWAADGNGFVVKRDLNIGVAIDVPDGLLVPVIHKADEKNLVGLARSLNDLITRARSKKLRLPDMQNGTFTVNNPGAFGSVLSYPIINQPQAAIITMEAIVKRPVVVEDAIAVRSIMNMCLSFDHRVVDGAYAGRFLQTVKRGLENFKD